MNPLGAQGIALLPTQGTPFRSAHDLGHALGLLPGQGWKSHIPELPGVLLGGSGFHFFADLPAMIKVVEEQFQALWPLSSLNFLLCRHLGELSTETHTPAQQLLL